MRPCRQSATKMILGFLLHLCHLVSSQYNQYTALVDKIEGTLDRAVKLHRAGQTQEALRTLDEIRQVFRVAVQLEPSEPDAYVAFAQAMLTSNQLNESIEAWESALERINAEKEPAMAQWALGRLRYARYGLVSMKRDALYAHGQGDLLESLKLVEEQLKIYPGFPSRYHDLATIQVMLFHFLEDSTNMTVASFQKSQDSAFHAWKAGLKERGRSKSDCDGRMFYSWKEALGFSRSLISLKPVTFGDESCGQNYCDHGAYVATFRDVGLSGDDGIIVDEKECQLFMASAGLAVDLAKNLQLLEIWGDPPAPHGGPRFRWFDVSQGRAPNHGAWETPMLVKKAASLVQFAGTSYFHIITEVFGRLWLLKEAGILDDPETRLILPKPFGFLAAGFKILTQGMGVSANRLIHWTSGPNDVLLRAETLYYANWELPVEFGKDGGHCPTPPSVLLHVRDALGAGFASAPSATEHLRPALVYIKRKQGEMRSVLHGEADFVQELKTWAPSVALEYITFNGQLKPKATARLFGRARIIVGFHGGVAGGSARSTSRD
ncbi:unnamed protein product [Durusdinium trenchii]|uniref:Glycosyltransferase 61 catalytic domain-containing protein n=1 Tax=Durusdinium trenchii TaxID=1381693 RepID=A0ABP0PT73_9DINO